MSKVLCTTYFILLIVLFLLFPPLLFASVDPLAVANNKIGIHILFPDEIFEAASLVNSNGGQWGYVTVPIQASDKNLEKWQQFMDNCRRLNIIPVVRLATEGDYFNSKVWRKPTFEDVLDFANFLDSLSWPTKNRYVIVFNEVNRADEWGGTVDPSEYAQILSYAVTIFKSKNQDFFIISAGLDNASANVEDLSMVSLDYLQQMSQAVPGIFYQIDGLGSHSYPNPGFSSPPTRRDRQSIASFQFEKKEVLRLGSRDLPVFITETGWSDSVLAQEKIKDYYTYAINNVWSDDKIVAITPFLLRASTGQFKEFSFLREDGSRSGLFNYIESIPKTKGKPALALNVTYSSISAHQIFPQEQLDQNLEQEKESDEFLSKSAVLLIKWLLKL